MQTLNLFSEQASGHAQQVDTLFLILAGISTAFVVLVGGALAVFAVKYRRSAVNQNPPRTYASLPLEMAAAVVPLALCLGLFGFGERIFIEGRQPAAGAVEIRVVGKQWMWKIQHSSGRKEINELHVPLGRPVKLLMASQDVLHDMFIPAFRIKQDLIPGRYTTEWFTPTKLGEYRFFCSQYCGTLHAAMQGTVTVMESADYQAWLEGKGKAESPVVAGERLFGSLGCLACHSNAKLAPPLAGVYMSDVKLSAPAGTTVLADAAYLRESLLDPNAKIVNGYQPGMPSFRGRITEEELLQLLAYIKSLKQ
jgi:cytochrome c oxidase subunit 2